MLTLVYKHNPAMRITVPKDGVSEGKRYWIIREDVFKQMYHIGDTYLKKNDWKLVDE